MIQKIKKAIKHLSGYKNCQIEEKVEYLESALTQMMKQYAEKRSDVHDYLKGILNGTDLDTLKSIPEHRYVAFSIGTADFVYDTYTTLVEYKSSHSNEWKIIDDIKYYDDEPIKKVFLIGYGRTAFVHTTREALDQIRKYINAWAEGDENLCISYEQFKEWIEECDETSFEDLSFLEFIKQVIASLKKDFSGDIVFCR